EGRKAIYNCHYPVSFACRRLSFLENVLARQRIARLSRGSTPPNSLCSGASPMRPSRAASWLSVWFRSAPSPSHRPRRRRLKAEPLEDRLAPAAITVLPTGDATGPLTPTGPGTFTAPNLRAAIDAANDEVNFAGADAITFAATLAGQTITA